MRLFFLETVVQFLFWYFQKEFWNTSNIHTLNKSIRTSKHFIHRREELQNTLHSFSTILKIGENNFTISQTFFNYTKTFLTQVDTNTGASLMLQSGARWLGLSLDLIGSVIVFTSVMAAILIGQTGPAGLGLLISYRWSSGRITRPRRMLVLSLKAFFFYLTYISTRGTFLVPISSSVNWFNSTFVPRN